MNDVIDNIFDIVNVAQVLPLIKSCNNYNNLWDGSKVSFSATIVFSKSIFNIYMTSWKMKYTYLLNQLRTYIFILKFKIVLLIIKIVLFHKHYSTLNIFTHIIIFTIRTHDILINMNTFKNQILKHLKIRTQIFKGNTLAYTSQKSISSFNIFFK